MPPARPSPFVALVGDDLAPPRNVEMLAAIEKTNKNKKRAPLSRAVVDRLRLQRTRGDKKATVPLPPSVRALLAYDAGLVLTWQPVFAMHKKALQARGGTLLSTTMADVYAKSAVAKAYRDLKKSAEANMPALIELGLASDQRVFLYVAEEARTKERAERVSQRRTSAANVERAGVRDHRFGRSQR